jgi:hypothetical protein
MITIFMFTTRVEYEEYLAETRADLGDVGFNAWARHELCWMNPEDLDEQWELAKEEMDLSQSYMVAVDWDFNTVREYTRKD